MFLPPPKVSCGPVSLAGGTCRLNRLGPYHSGNSPATTQTFTILSDDDSTTFSDADWTGTGVLWRFYLSAFKLLFYRALQKNLLDGKTCGNSLGNLVLPLCTSKESRNESQ